MSKAELSSAHAVCSFNKSDKATSRTCRSSSSSSISSLSSPVLLGLHICVILNHRFSPNPTYAPSYSIAKVCKVSNKSVVEHIVLLDWEVQRSCMLVQLVRHFRIVFLFCLFAEGQYSSGIPVIPSLSRVFLATLFFLPHPAGFRTAMC